MTASLSVPGILTTPQLRYTESQIAVCEAMLCFKQNNRGQPADRQIKVTTYGKLALSLKDIPGGSVASISGYPEIHEIQKTGYKEKRVVLVADTIHIYRDGEFVELSGGTEDDAAPVARQPRNAPAALAAPVEADFDLNDDDIPF